MTPHVKALLESGAQFTDAALERLLPGPEIPPHSIHRAMRHSVFAGGKRLRPIFVIEAARATAGFGAHSLTSERHDDDSDPLHRDAAKGRHESISLPAGAAELGAALEMIHTYSLIHDDLPALDNDDLRRGQPTCHVVFGEAIAVLAGDALQTLAFQTMAQLPVPAVTTVSILREVALAIGTGLGDAPDTETTQAMPGGAQTAASVGVAGVGACELPPGMVGGQVVDIESEGAAPTPALVEQIHRAKTGALITASIVAGGLLGLAYRADLPLHQHADLITRLRSFGQNAGLAFQIVDDMLDITQDSTQLGKTAGKDMASIKATWPAVFGLERSGHDARGLIAEAFAALDPLGDAADSLKSLALYLVDRRH